MNVTHTAISFVVFQVRSGNNNIFIIPLFQNQKTILKS